MTESRLSIVLHTHMPWVVGYGVWPVGEEWLWEAAATSYLPLLELLDEDPGRITLSVTPVLADQLRAPGVHARLTEFVTDTRARTHARDTAVLMESEPQASAELQRAAGDYQRAASQLAQRGEDGIANGLLEHATWTSAATHALLPLIATDRGLDLQIGSPAGDGFWLPECAYADWIEPALARANARICCVDLSGVEGDTPGAPISTANGVVLVPVDRGLIDLVWAATGFPAAAAYRDSHRFSPHGHRPWANDGSVYSAERAAEQLQLDAAAFVAAAIERGGLSVFAVDTELLGDWWYEGIAWLRAVLSEADRRGLGVVQLTEGALDVARRRTEVAPTSWGRRRDLSTWSGPRVSDMAFATRSAELTVLRGDPDPQTLRELKLLQSSDWAFMVSRDTAAQYGRERFGRHLSNAVGRENRS